MRIGVISDTHGLLRPEAEQRLAGVAHIVHAGDIGRPDIIVGLRRIAPVIAIRGNVDTDHWAERYPDTKMVRLGGRSIYVLHDIHELRLDPVSCGVDVVISGRSHRPRIETIRGVLYLNPGSAGPRRFNLPITLALLEVTKSGLRPFIHHLGSASSDYPASCINANAKNCIQIESFGTTDISATLVSGIDAGRAESSCTAPHASCWNSEAGSVFQISLRSGRLMPEARSRFPKKMRPFRSRKAF